MNIFDLSKVYSSYFDVVLEYTCYCAIDPKNRTEYIKNIHHILKTGGELVALFFPINKILSNHGPPFGVEINSTVNLFTKKFVNIYSDLNPSSIKPRLGSEAFFVFKKI